MYKPDLTKILNDELVFLVNNMKDSMEYVGRKYVLNDSQLSEIARDYIARLAFAAIIGDEKEPEKKPEKSDGLPDDVINALSIVKCYCLEHSCDDCIFNKSDQCKIKYTPNEWRI